MKRFAAILAFSTVAFTASQALADSNSPVGRLSDIVTFTTSSDNASSYSGYVIVTPPGSPPQLYFWGGPSCTNVTPITTAQFQILAHAVIERKNIVVFYKKPSSLPCITGFALSGG
jgi:hypothetical protein